MRVKATVAVLVLSLAPGPALAQPEPTWRQASGGDGLTAYLNTSSISRTGDKAQVWRELRSVQPRPLGTDGQYDTIGSLIEFDCRGKTLRTLRVYVKLGGRTIVEGPEEGGVEPIAHGSTAETDFRAVCFNEWPN